MNWYDLDHLVLNYSPVNCSCSEVVTSSIVSGNSSFYLIEASNYFYMTRCMLQRNGFKNGCKLIQIVDDLFSFLHLKNDRCFPLKEKSFEGTIQV